MIFAQQERALCRNKSARTNNSVDERVALGHMSLRGTGAGWAALRRLLVCVCMYVKLLLNISMNRPCRVSVTWSACFYHTLYIRCLSSVGPVCVRVCVCTTLYVCVCAVYIYIAGTALVGGVAWNFVIRLSDWLRSVPLPLLIDWRGILRIDS